MWGAGGLYPEQQAGSPSRFNLTVKELLLAGGSGDPVSADRARTGRAASAGGGQGGPG